MMGKRKSADAPQKQSRACHDGLTPEIAEQLAGMALMSETHAGLSTAIGETRHMLASLAERRPEFRGASGELLVKLKALEQLQATLGMEVMRYSHRYEDVMAGTP